MKGLWKEELSGWNHKDSKRKRQNRNHTIKDNLNELKKSLNSDYINNKNISKNELEIISYKDNYSNYIILNKNITLYLLDITYRDRKNKIKNIIFKGFFIGYNNKTIIDHKTKKEFCDLYNLNCNYNIIDIKIVKELGYIKNLSLDLIELKDKFNGYKKNIKYKNTNIDNFFINKKLIHYRYDPKTKKNLQNFTNRTNRCKVKNFIKNGNFENEQKLPFKIQNNKNIYLD